MFIVPVLYFLDWDYHAIFRMPSGRDVALAVALFVGYLIYAMLMGILLEHFGIVSSGLVDGESVTIMMIFTSIFTVMGEEFMKFIPFMFLLRVIYKYTHNRKLAIIVSVALIMVMFASIHAYNYIMFLYALFIQALDQYLSFMDKTKNILVSYITHLCTDVFIFALFLFGF